MKTELWPLERLIDYARNPRKNDHAVDRVAAAIREFGFRVPIVAKSDGLVVDGHLRLKAVEGVFFSRRCRFRSTSFQHSRTQAE